MEWRVMTVAVAAAAAAATVGAASNEHSKAAEELVGEQCVVKAEGGG
jgi:hypothetical protein